MSGGASSDVAGLLAANAAHDMEFDRITSNAARLGGQPCPSVVASLADDLASGPSRPGVSAWVCYRLHSETMSASGRLRAFAIR